MYRHPHTHQERKANQFIKGGDIEDRLFRGRRSCKYLPHAWDDIHRSVPAITCWKDANKPKYRTKKMW